MTDHEINLKWFYSIHNVAKSPYEYNSSFKGYFSETEDGFMSYEEAELECLKKLIKIVNKKQK